MIRLTCRLAVAGLLVVAIAAAAGESGPSIGCQAGIDSAGKLNAHDLFGVAMSCAQENRSLDTAFALIAGQLRATADMVTMKPSGEDDEMKIAELYGFIYYRAGGAGSTELYRDPEQTARLFDRIRLWRPELPDNYDPGWAYRQSPDKAKYYEYLDYDRTVRLLQLQSYAELVRDAEYLAAQTEFEELQLRNPKGFQAGTADHDRAEQLMQIMGAVSKRIPEPRHPKPPKFEYTPDPEAEFRQVYTGFNGVPETGTTIAWDLAEAEKAWWRIAIGERAFGALLDQVDFDREMLLVHTLGRHDGTTGRIVLVDVDIDRQENTLSVSVSLGVNEEDCEWTPAESFPFAIAIVARTAERPYIRGYYHANFGDGCKQPVSGEASRAT